MTTGGSAVDNFDSMPRSSSLSPIPQYCSCGENTCCICVSQIKVKTGCPVHDRLAFLQNHWNTRITQLTRIYMMFLLWAKSKPSKPWANPQVLKLIHHYTMQQFNQCDEDAYLNQACNECGGTLCIRCTSCYCVMDEVVSKNTWTYSFRCLTRTCHLRFSAERPIPFNDPLSPLHSSLLTNGEQLTRADSDCAYSDSLSDHSLDSLFYDN